MMLRYLFAVLILCTSSIAVTQNLVPNWSFEEYDECPTSLSQLMNADNWISFRSSPDLFASCASYESGAGVPINSYFQGSCLPMEGENFGGYVQFDYPSLLSEVLAVQLISPLQIGNSYYVSFYVRRRALNSSNCWSNNIAATFTMQEYADWPLNETMPINNNPDIFHEESVQSQEVWQKVDGWFMADSAYTHLAIGNMYDPELLDIECDNDYSTYQVYYHVDCVCVSQSESYCDELLTTINENELNALRIYPNPASSYLYFSDDLGSSTKLEVYNANGKLVSERIKLRANNIFVGDLSPGTYFIRLFANDKTHRVSPFVKE